MAGRKDMASEGQEHRFKPGESGNPSGRPPGIQNSKTRLLRWLSQELDVTNPATKKKERATVLEMMDAALIQKALKGDVNAYRELVDRFEGKVPNKDEVNLTGNVSLIINPAHGSEPISPEQESESGV